MYLLKFVFRNLYVNFNLTSLLLNQLFKIVFTFLFIIVFISIYISKIEYFVVQTTTIRICLIKVFTGFYF